MGGQLSLDTGPNPYATFKGKTYLKAVLLAQANSALEQGEKFILPPGVVFEPTTTQVLYVALKRLPFDGRFLAQRYDEEVDEQPIHAMAYAVKRVVELPDDCPPVTEWERANV
jgi:hypothetical protein